MTVHPVTPIAAGRLKGMDWRPVRAYKLLSYLFRLKSNSDLLAERIDEVLGGFATAPASTSNGDVYYLIDLGRREPRRYRLLRDDEQLIGSRSLADVIHQLMYQLVERVMERTDEFLLIHSGAVVSPRGDGILLPAEAGSGKTTLVAGLVRAGFGFLSDEVGVLDPLTRRLYPFPRAFNFKDGSLSVFPDLEAQDDGSPLRRGPGYTGLAKIRPGAGAGPSQVSFVIFPSHTPGVGTEVTALSPAETTKELWANAMNLPHFGARALPILAQVSRESRGYRLVSGGLEGAVRAVVEITEATAGAPVVRH